MESWESVLTTQGQLEAEMYCDILRKEGIPAVTAPRDAVSFLGVSPFPCRVMVPKNLVGEAKAVLSSYLENQPE